MKNTINQGNLEENWANFFKKETYLTFDDKERFFNEIKQLIKYPWYYWLVFPLYLKERSNIKKLDKLKQQIINYNNGFIKKRLMDYSTFFDGKDDGLKYPLDEDQRMAVVKDDKHNLVIAGAGSGKTSVIASRIAYLIRRKDKVEKDRILALAFTRVAADEMRKRLLNEYGIDIEISTFHALGRNIIYEEMGIKPKLLFNGSEKQKHELIDSIFNEILNEKIYQDILVDYLAYHSEQEVDEATFEEKEEFFKYMKNKNYSTLNGIVVKSIAERDIGNFFFLHNIDFEYEPLAEWVDESDEDREYHPDFYLPEYDIYIEHWGLNKDLKVPEWFSVSSEEYLELRDWKLSQFEKHQKILIETWDYERFSLELIPNLKEKLIETNLNIKFEPLSYHKIVEKTFEFKEKQNEIAKLVGNFIEIAKCNFFMVEDIAERIELKEFSRKQKLFGQLALEVYKRYQKYLKKEERIDFNDMINLAVELIKTNPEKYLNRYEHVLVDEFQDISHQRMELIRCFVNENSNTRLFCVGDDWQSIYQFTGSDVRFFVNFENYFPNPEISYLNRNYRSAQKIVEMSNDLISHNKKQIQKEAYSTADLGQTPIYFQLSKKFDYSHKMQMPNIYNLIQLLLNEGVEPHEIMVLSRFNRYLWDLEIYCGARGIPTESDRGGVRFYSAHKSKGSESEHVILTDVTSGVYGFPCEIQDSSVMEIAKRFKTESFFEEERRLFYVALTRSKRFLYTYSIESNESMFLDEISPFLMNIHIDTTERWNETLPNYLSKYIEGIDIEIPIVCPNCGKFLEERKGKYGKFLGCSGYPDCDFIFNIDVEDKISCPVCGNRLIPRKGKYGNFLGCIKYPQCKFTFDLDKRTKKNIYCPKCGKRLVVRSGKQGKSLGCTGFPQCDFAFNIGSDVQKSQIERIEKTSKVTPINTKRIMNVLSKDLQNIKKLATKLNIKDEMDIRYLQIKLKELERKGFVKMKVSKHEKYWFIK